MTVMFRFDQEPEDDTEAPVGYWIVELDGDALDFIQKACAAYTSGAAQAARAAAIQALADAEFRPGLAPEKLPWAELEAEAARQGCSIMDVLFDRMGHIREPGFPKLRKREKE